MLDGIRVREGRCAFGPYETWYRVTGESGGARLPLVVLHGGPGCTHDYVESYADLAADGRAVIHYDQIGNGRSTHRRDAPPDFWRPELFLDELDALLGHLGIAGRYAVLGQSWGGMLAAEHAVRRPVGLKALVIANSPSSMRKWIDEAGRLRALLPPGVQEVLARHEAARDYDAPAYQQAARAFYLRHVCRMDPFPDSVARTFAAVAADPTVYRSMNGPTEFHVTGSLAGWTVEDRLPQVNVPTLVLSGLHDEATPLAVEAYAARIPGAEWLIFGKSSHMPHVEERALCMAVAGDFLRRAEESGA